MIHSFANSRTQRLAEGVPGVIPMDIDRTAQKRLRLLEAATSVKDLRHLPSINFQAEKPRYSVHVSGRWRIQFLWPRKARAGRAPLISPTTPDAMPRIPIHPGEILADELQATGSTAPWLARTIAVPQRRFLQIILGKRPITADIALRLETIYAVNPRFWMNLQTIYDQDRARQESEDVIGKTAQRRRPQRA